MKTNAPFWSIPSRRASAGAGRVCQRLPVFDSRYQQACPSPCRRAPTRTARASETRRPTRAKNRIAATGAGLSRLSRASTQPFHLVRCQQRGPGQSPSVLSTPDCAGFRPGAIHSQSAAFLNSLWVSASTLFRTTGAKGSTIASTSRRRTLATWSPPMAGRMIAIDLAPVLDLRPLGHLSDAAAVGDLHRLELLDQSGHGGKGSDLPFGGVVDEGRCSRPRIL